MLKQKDLVNNRQWDMLFIFDACRYDKFNKFKHLMGNGHLEKTKSQSTWTGQWMLDIFKEGDWKDAIFFSSNPFVNSKGKKVKIFSWYKRLQCLNWFNVNEVFKEVIDVWDFGFDKQVGTVPPWEMNKAIVKVMEKNKSARAIVHYGQPHFPFICCGGGAPATSMKGIVAKDKFEFKKPLIRISKKLLNDIVLWKIYKNLNMLPKRGKGALWFSIGTEGMIQEYEKNLRLVMLYAKKIMDKYPKKKIAITADHGDMLGEHNRFGHGWSWYKEKRYVPWFESGD